ncbi:family 43 glycosylhydrolase [Microbacteriaceae bacterium VKM Ac-2854]|nr:family 43 glycosylhydrolase [Microbacteriaceae bacterium VKM Ac-2854]
MGRYRNPILPGCHPDPSLCRVGDAFYLVTSTFEYLPGLPVHRSTNLVDWAPVGHAIHRPDQLSLAGLPSSRGLFAPTIRHDGERFLVVCTVVGPDDGTWSGRSGHFVVTATDAAGPWSDPVWIEGVGGIDPSLTLDGERLWLCWTQQRAERAWAGQTDVLLTELDPGTLQPLREPVAIWGGAMIGAVWAEGPHILPRPGGGWLLVAAEGGTSREHAVCVAYAETITGPYYGDPGNPRLSHRDLGGTASIAAVGHADLVEDTAGRSWATVLATQLDGGADGLLGRQTHLVPVAWEQRRPVFAPGDGRVRAVVDAEGVPDQRAASEVFEDAFDAAPLEFGWTGVARQPSAFAQAGGGRLLLHAGAEPTSTGPQSFLGRRLPASDTDVEAVVGVGATALRGGLLLRSSETAQLEFSVDATGTVRCQLTAAGVRSELGAITADAARVRLRLEIRGLRARAFADGAFVAEAELDALVPDPGTGFVGAWIGVVAVGTAGTVKVDSVTLTAEVAGTTSR